MFGLFDPYKKALYGWIRRRMKPISIEEAEEKKLLLARLYAFFSWSALGYLTYKAFQGDIKLPMREDLPKNVATALQISKNQNVRFITFRGFEKVEDFTYTKEELQKIADGELVINPNLRSNKPTLNPEPQSSDSTDKV